MFIIYIIYFILYKHIYTYVNNLHYFMTVILLMRLSSGNFDFWQSHMKKQHTLKHVINNNNKL